MTVSRMPIGRRGFLTGLISLAAAPAIVRAENLMPVRSLPIGEMSLDGVPFDPRIDLDQFLLGRLAAEAAQRGLQIRRPRFCGYVTTPGFAQQHRRCTVEVVDAPWLRV